MDSVRVLAPSKSYYVHIGAGLLDVCGEIAKPLRGGGQALVVSDSNVAPLYASRTMQSLERAGFSPSLHVFPAGEQSKNAQSLLEILTRMAQLRMTRGDTLFALGGGVTGDLGGLAASLYMRGIGLVQLPTSLLAAVDSSVGGKTAIDLEEGKNLVGTFYQPDLVLYDSGTAATLPPQQTANGFGEIIKTGFITDADLFEAAARESITSEQTADIVRRCVEIKRDVVRQDEKETGLRQILNFGHTFGHAVEKCARFSVPHGFCVAEGMLTITAACAARGICSRRTLDRLSGALARRGVPRTADFSAKELYSAMLSDKKRSSNAVTLVIPRKIGSVERRRV
ncbi:MAG: 3-dehydroquinate synthase [Pyramidobacter sp.]|nr:3-dehydroquinate synthase [Pyramidobacter sp.]